MIISVTEEMRRKMTKDGSVLKYLRNTGGMNKGCFAGGIFLVITAAVSYTHLDVYKRQNGNIRRDITVWRGTRALEETSRLG